MASIVGRAFAGRRVVPSMECALVCLLLALSVAGYTMDLDRKVRAAATGMIVAAYTPEVRVAVRGVPLPKDATVRVQAQAVATP